MLALERPRLRPYVQPVPALDDILHIYLVDRLGLAEAHRLTLQEYHWVTFFDGKRALPDIQREAMRMDGGRQLSLDSFVKLVTRLDDNLFLDSPRFRNTILSPIRPPRHIGCYHRDPDRLRRQLAELFTAPGGPGLPVPGKRVASAGRLRAALVPHMDYGRGGVTYGWGFKEICERTDASLFVIIATSHHSRNRFTLTRKNFQTPLGIVPTDQNYMDRLVRHFGPGLFDDELLAHLPEHSVDLEVVLLHYLFEKHRPIRIVPLVVGSFHDCIRGGVLPSVREDIAAMIQALRRVEAEMAEPICYIISGDLAHIGPKFGGRQPLTLDQLCSSKRQDQALLGQAETADPAGFFQRVAQEKDARNICGLPPTYLFLEALRPTRGKVLHYNQYVHPRGLESVSYASVTFDG